MTRREWQFSMLVAFVAAILTQLPYVLGHTFARPGTEFTGLLINLEDASYLSIISQGMDGAWQYHIQFTSEPHSPAFLYGFYLVLGHLARVFSVSNVVMWHLSRVAAALFLFLTVYAFLSRYLPDVQQRRVAYLIAIFGAGFDWFVFPFESIGFASGVPIDFKMPEAHLFFSALTYPHFSVGIALTLSSFMLIQGAWDQHSWRAAILAGISNLALGVVYPFLIYLVFAVLGVYFIYLSWCARKIERWRLATLLVSFLIPAPLYVYYAYVLMANLVFRIWDAQAVTLSPNPLHYLLTYGVILFLGGSVLVDSFRKQKEFVFLWIWVIVAAILLYSPLNAQRRFVEGLQVPLAILATTGIFQMLLPRLEQTRFFRALVSRPRYSVEGLRSVIFASLLFALSISSLIILIQLSAMTALQQPDPLFRPSAELHAMDWLRDHSLRNDAVLASYPTASYIPARSGNIVFVGQRYETNHFDEKVRQSEIFFDAKTSDAWRGDLLKQNHIAYVFVGPRERELGGSLSSAHYLQSVFSNSIIQIYSVQLK